VTTNNRKINQIIYRARVARLATADSKAIPHIIPVVFAFDGEKYYIPVDEKPKITKPDKLRRIKNIEVNPAVALLIDEYNEDWNKLLFIIIQGKASMLGKRRENDKEEREEQQDNSDKLLKYAHKLLFMKYPQYQYIAIGRLCIVIHPRKTIFWSMLSTKNKRENSFV
jgi:PPOX class probable F420-dependent enzyme